MPTSTSKNHNFVTSNRNCTLARITKLHQSFTLTEVTQKNVQKYLIFSFLLQVFHLLWCMLHKSYRCDDLQSKFSTESEELRRVTELEDDGEDLVVKIFHLFLRSPQPLKFIIWDLKGTRAESILGVSRCRYFTFPSPNMINSQ